MNSPLGRYAAPTAAIAAILIIGAYVLSLVFNAWLHVEQASLTPLSALAFTAAGAIFGSAVAVNGYKAPLEAAHKRLDALEAPPADHLADELHKP